MTHHKQLGSAINILRDLLKSYDLESEAIFKQAGIAPESLHDPDIRISSGKANKVWEIAANSIGDSCFAVQSGKFWHPSYMNALGYSWMTSETLMSGLEKLTRYFAIISNRVNLALEIRDELGVLLVDYQSEGLPPFHRRIILLSTIVAMCRTNFGSDFCPKQVLLADSTSQCLYILEEYFLAEIAFSSSQDGLIFRADDLTKVLMSSNPVLDKMHDRVLQAYLVKLQTKDIRQQVEYEIAQGLSSGMMTEEFIAGKLKVSVRSLHRKLKERQTRFSHARSWTACTQ